MTIPRGGVRNTLKTFMFALVLGPAALAAGPRGGACAEEAPAADPARARVAGEQEVGEQEVGEQEVGEQEVGEQEVGEQEVGEQEVGEQEVGEQEVGEQETGEHESVSLRGRVVWLAEAMTKRHGVTFVPEAEDRVLALQTADGRLWPLVEDVRGRGFRRDERLRTMEVELLARRFADSPFLQIIRTYQIDEGRKYELDYWCEICAIAMYELKACDCCQGPIELRRREVKK